MIGVRLGESGFEGRCDGCLEYWPIEPEFWPVPTHGTRLCRACDNEKRRIIARGRRAAQVEYNRQWRELNREQYNAKVRQRRLERRLADLDTPEATAKRERHTEYMRRWRESHAA